VIRLAGERANLAELKGDVEKTPASERLSQGYSSRRNGAMFRRQRPCKPAQRQMKGGTAIANLV